MGRLRVWAANVGVHQTGQSSLAFRLRDASPISNQITKLLRDLCRSLDEILGELLEDRTEASENTETSAFWLDDNPTTELQQLHEEVVNIVDCLYQLSLLIRNSAQHEDDDDDVVDARASTSENAVTIDNADSPDLFDHASSGSVTDDEY